MSKPVLVIVNGLPGSGKTTLAKRLAEDIRLPLFSRDHLYETLHDSLEGDDSLSSRMGLAAFRLMYEVTDSVLAAGHSVIVEGFFGRPDLRTAEFLELQRRSDFTPFQILCRADGAVLVERFLARANSPERHTSHADADLVWLQANRERLLQGVLEPLALDGPLLEIDTTTPDRFDYRGLLQKLRATL